MKKAKIFISILICLSLLFLMSVDFLEYGHECMGDNCEICIFVALCHEVLGRCISVGLLLRAVLFGADVIFKSRIQKNERSGSDDLISKKVKLTA